MKNYLLALGLFSLATASQAAISTTEVTAAISDAGTAAGVVGAAVLVVFIGIKAYKWVRRAM